MHNLGQTPSGHDKKIFMEPEKGFSGDDVVEFDLPVDSEHKAKVQTVHAEGPFQLLLYVATCGVLGE